MGRAPLLDRGFEECARKRASAFGRTGLGGGRDRPAGCARFAAGEDSLVTWLPGKLAIAGTATVVLVTLVASYLVARTPDAVLGGQIVAVPTAPSSSAAVPYTLKSGASARQV